MKKINKFGELSLLNFEIHDIGMFYRAMYFKKFLCTDVVREHLSQRQIYILDAGCGEGDYSFYLAQRFPQAQIKAIDTNDQMLNKNKNTQKAAGISNITFSSGNIIDLSEKERYDFIVCIAVLIHRPYDEQVKMLSNLASALKEDGIIYLFVTCKDWEKSLVLNIRFYKRMYSHFVSQNQGYIFSIKELSSLLEQLKMHVIRKKIVSGWWGELSWEIDKIFKEHNVERWKILLLPLLKIMCLIDTFIECRRGTGMVLLAQKNKNYGYNK